MNTTAILPHSVNLILQYISPPSQLNKPLPPHLISNDLLQRHHFLQPETPDAYLCWPSIHQHRIIALLEALRVDDDCCAIYPVRYTRDDRTYAHVAITSDLRIVFQWDSLDGWKYHDAKLMPFPPGCSASLQLHDNPEQNSPSLEEHDTTEEDIYWNAYGQEEGDQESRILGSQKDDGQEDAEDAYWAQYATVQGSGDSTLPSPLPPDQKKQFATQVHARLEAPLVFSRSAIDPSARSHFEPPSPNTIATALSVISLEKSQPVSPSFQESEPGSYSDLTVPSPPSEVTGSVDGAASAGFVSEDNVTSLLAAETGRQRPEQLREFGGDVDHHKEGEEFLRRSIRGIYCLWKAGRRNISQTVTDEAENQWEEKQLFLHIVQEAVDSPCEFLESV